MVHSPEGAHGGAPSVALCCQAAVAAYAFVCTLLRVRFGGKTHGITSGRELVQPCRVVVISQNVDFVEFPQRLRG